MMPTEIQDKRERIPRLDAARFLAGVPTLVVLVLLACVGTPGTARAQTTGKIAGTVTAAETGNPLPGVNVVVEGTGLGTATNGNGEYTIIGVRPGLHTVRASFVGFQTQIREEVRVQVGLTTTVDFDMGEQVVEGEEVTVTAQSGGIQKDLTSSETRVTSEAIDNLPVQEVGDILTAQAGITSGDGGLHIRGGRSGEVAYFIDGVRVSDAYDGSISVQVENNAIQELQVISGTFNAEYGQAMSGIINAVTKQGGSEYEGSFEAFTGSYLVGGSGGADVLRGRSVQNYDRSREGVGYLNVDPYSYLGVDPTQYYNLRGTLSGPLFTDRLTFFALGRYFHNDGWMYGARLVQPDGTPGDSSLVSMNPYSKFSGQFNLKWKLRQNMSLSLLGLGSMQEGQNYSHAWRWNPGGRPQYQNDGYNLSLKFRHTLGANAFYTFNVANYYKHYERHACDDINSSCYNSLLLTNPDVIVDTTGAQPQAINVPKGNGRFLRYGVDLGRFRRTSNAWLAKSDLTTQLTKRHLVQTGVEVRLDQLRLTDYSLVQSPNDPNELVVPDRSTSRFRRFRDIKPITASAYIQDKIEYDDFIVNAGIRFDYFDSRGRVPADREDPNIFNPLKPSNIYNDANDNGEIDDSERADDNLKTVAQRRAYWWEDAEPKWQLSPRIGVAYPITAEGAIHFSYGHFLQIPTLRYLFNNYDYKFPNTSGTYGPFANADLDAQKTVMYEIGLQQAVGPVVLDVTGFYRDVRDWVSTPAAPYDTYLPGVNYVLYLNRDYSNVRGVTLTLDKQLADHYSLKVDYTYQVAEGSNSSPEQEFFSRQGDAPPTIALTPLNWDQRHTLNVSAFYGGDTWGASVLARFGSGYPYTPVFSTASGQGAGVIGNLPNNSRRQPTTFKADLYAYKDFPVGGLTPRFFAQVYNLLDARNAGAVYGDTGQPDVTLNPAPTRDPGYYVRPDFYSEPRRMQVGLELKF